MRRHLLFIPLMLLFFVTPSYAFIDSIVGTVTKNIDSARDAAYQAFMKIKVVEQIKVAYDNYREAKRFADKVEEQSRHEGGIVGYMKDEIMNNMQRGNDDKYWEFENYMNTPSEDKQYVKGFLTSVDQRIQKKLDYTKEIHDVGKKIEDRIARITKDASKDTMSEKEINRFNREIMITQLELLAAIYKNSTQNMKWESEQDARDWSTIRQQLIEREKRAADVKSFYENMSRNVGKHKISPYDIIKETPRGDR